MHQKPKALVSIGRAVIAITLAISSAVVFAEPEEPKKLLNTRMSIQPMDLKRDLSREDLIAAGQLGGHLYPTEAQEDAGDKQRKGKRQAMRQKFGEVIVACLGSVVVFPKLAVVGCRVRRPEYQQLQDGPENQV
ncbi:hypothetical protein [Microbulbifer sp.]|uniref:hypothetical protein n=1 Tax=Microbulbifer sp. TaxID=1908541 RepID=UPI003F2B2CC8